ncbi:MAG: methyltransferase domain-containing protein [Halieaceae bacterium]
MSRASNLLANELGAPVANFSFSLMQRYIHSARKSGLGMLHTARPFSYYRKTLYHNQSRRQVLDSLRDKTVVDIGCGYTPFAKDSMFRACHDAGVEFFGVDPLFQGDVKIGIREKALARFTGGSGRFSSKAPGLTKTLANTAQDLPFDAASVDEILCSYLLFVWIEDEEQLADIFEEFHRVLTPGGIVRMYPLGDWRMLRFSSDRLKAIVARFSVTQSFVFGGADPRVMSAMLTELVKD